MKAGTRRQQSSRKQPVRRQQMLRRQADDDDDSWSNKGEKCQDDEIQVIFNNSKGKEKEVNFRVVNRGKCPLRIAVTEGRDQGAMTDRDQKIPGGTKERVNITVPAGCFLQVVCNGRDEKCDWTISDLKCC